MLRFYAIEEQKLKPVKEFKAEKITWCDASVPTDDEIIEISKKFAINFDDLQDCLDENERPRFNFDLLLKNQFLLYRGIQNFDIDVRKMPTSPIGIFFTKDEKIITIHSTSLLGIEKFIELLNRQKVESPLSILLDMLHIFTTQSDQYAQKIAVKIRELQAKMMSSQNAADIQRPFDLNSHLILFNTAMLANMNAMKAFYNKNKSIFDTNLSLFEKYDDILTDIDQTYAFSSIYRDIMANSLDAYASVINNNVTAVMKVVGSIQLILSIPMLIASIYGMNVYMPGSLEQGPFWTFLIIIIVSFALSIITWRIFRRKNWL